MAKDPAFLFYPGDWLGGTIAMSREEKGAYIDLLMCQFNQGHMTYHMIERMLGQDAGRLWTTLKDKFQVDDEGRFYNVKLENEQKARKSYTDSRKNNKKGLNQHTPKKEKIGHMTSHMENEDVDVDVNELKGVKGEKENPYTPIPKVDTFRGMVMNFLQAPPINYIWTKDDTIAFVDISYKIGAVLANEGVPVTEQTKFEAFKMVIENLSEWTRLNRFQLTHLNKDWNANYQHARKQARKKQPNGSGVDAKAERVLD